MPEHENDVPIGEVQLFTKVRASVQQMDSSIRPTVGSDRDLSNSLQSYLLGKLISSIQVLVFSDGFTSVIFFVER